MRRIVSLLVVAGLIGLAIFWFVTAPKTTDAAEIDGLTPDLDRGKSVFIAGGCASCHSAPDTKDEAKLVLAGGRAFSSDFGTFYAPNISPDPEQGIGTWRPEDLVNAMRHGTSPAGQHYFPAFPYTSYARAETADIVSLFAYIQTLPASDTASLPHDVGFPFNIRRSLGGWKMLFAANGWVIDEPATEQLQRGRYLVEALGHCGECHTPRNVLGGLKLDQWLGGAPNPSGQGNIPNITPGKLTWSEDDLYAYFTTGFTPEFDTVGGSMVSVVENLSKMPEEDVRAIIAYLRIVPPVE